jgi:hypothetical protein
MSLEISSGSLDKVFVTFEAFSGDGGFTTDQVKKGLELHCHAQDNRGLQVCVGEGNVDGQLVPSQ